MTLHPGLSRPFGASTARSIGLPRASVFAAFDALAAREQGGPPRMIVGAALIEIHVHGSRSLKQKRGVVRSIVQRVRNRFNLSVAEVGGQDTWQRALLALGAVGSDERVLRSALERAIDFIEQLHLAELLGSEIEILELPQEQPLDVDEGTWEERV